MYLITIKELQKSGLEGTLNTILSAFREEKKRRDRVDIYPTKTYIYSNERKKMTWSKEYRSTYNKEYYLKRKEHIKEYYLKNKDHIKEYHLKNKERIKEVKKQYYLKNREHLNAYMKEYHLKNKERTKAYYRGYYLKNKILILQKHKIYRENRCATNTQ